MPDQPSFPAVVESRIGDVVSQTVNARDLHRALRVGKDFSTWIKDRIASFSFAEHVDFESFEDLRSPDSGSTKARPQRAVEYALTLDMAKELAMVERNEAGKRVRTYFIECERKLRERPGIDTAKLLSDPVAMRGMLLGYTEKVIALEAKVEEMAPKAEAHDRLAGTVGSMAITDAAKTLKMGRDHLIRWLSTHLWIYKRPRNSSWIARQERINAGYMEHDDFSYRDSQGQERVATRARVTGKGLLKLAKLLNVELDHVAHPAPPAGDARHEVAETG